MRSGEKAERSGREEARRTCRSADGSESRSHQIPGAGLLDPRRDFFNRLLEKYSAKSMKSNTSNINTQCHSSTRIKIHSQKPKSPPKFKEKFLKKKKADLEKVISSKSNVSGEEKADWEGWKNRVRQHPVDVSIYRNHCRIRSRFGFPPLPTIQELTEPSSSDSGEGDESSCNLRNKFRFRTKHREGDGTSRREGEDGESSEDHPRRMVRTTSGTLVWIGNQQLIEAIQKRERKRDEGGKTERSREVRDIGSTSQEKQSRKSKNKKQLVPDSEEGAKSSKQSGCESKHIKSSSMHPSMAQEDVTGRGKRLTEKAKKPKKLTKKQPVTLVTSKPTT